MDNLIIDKAAPQQANGTGLIEERLRLALRAGQIGTYDFNPLTQSANGDARFHAIFGIREDVEHLFGAVKSAVHPDDRDAWHDDVQKALDPAGRGHHDFEIRIIRPDTGEERWIHTQADAIFENGVAVRMVGAVRDMTEEKHALERERLLAKEFNHRIKNVFTVVTAMIRMSARDAATPKDLAESVEGRVQAMATAHALIQPSVAGDPVDDVEVSLQALVGTVLKPYMQTAERVLIDGPWVVLGPKEASGLALILHEWATNAAKYGGLSTPLGRLDLSWKISSALAPIGELSRSLTLTWRERGGPAVSGAPVSKGFGSKLIEGTARPPSFSKVRTIWHPQGVEHEIDLLIR